MNNKLKQEICITILNFTHTENQLKRIEAILNE